MLFLHTKCEHIKNMSPFLTCFPLLPTAEPYGQGNTRLSHIKRRRLIMPLVALVQKITAHPQLRTLVWCSALPSSSPLLLAFRLRKSECMYKMVNDCKYYSCSNMGKGVKMENNTKNKTTNNANKAQKATTKNTANVKNKTANTKNCGKGCDCKER